MTSRCIRMRRSRSLLQRLQNQEQLNFWLTNRIPRNLLTRWMGRFSRIQSRRLTAVSIRIWRLFADDLRLDEAETQDFSSLQACFTRRLRSGARPLDPDPDCLISPCDAVIGAHGTVEDGLLLQAKGMVYRLAELLRDPELAAAHRDGCYVTLRLKSSMYHRFHAPCDGRIERLDYIGGERFNVNPPALARIPGLFCRNERAVLPLIASAQTSLGPVTLVPVAAILVASMRFSFLDPALDLRGSGPRRIECMATFRRGDELGHFEHGSTLILLTGPEFGLDEHLQAGDIIRMGQALLRRIG